MVLPVVVPDVEEKPGGVASALDGAEHGVEEVGLFAQEGDGGAEPAMGVVGGALAVEAPGFGREDFVGVIRTEFPPCAPESTDVGIVGTGGGGGQEVGESEENGFAGRGTELVERGEWQAAGEEAERDFVGFVTECFHPGFVKSLLGTGAENPAGEFAGFGGETFAAGFVKEAVNSGGR